MNILKNLAYLQALRFLALSVMLLTQSAQAKNQAPEFLNDTTFVTVQILNFAGQSINGQIAVTPQTRQPVMALFAELYKVGFRFENVLPMNALPGSFTAALQAHQTFAFQLPAATGSSDLTPTYALAINPLSNPVLSFLTSSQTSPEVLPFDGVYALNAARNPLPGRVDNNIETIFKKHGFVRYTGSAKQAFFGVFAYLGSMPAHQSQSSSRDISPRMQQVPPPVVTPLSEAMKQSLIASGAWHKGCPVDLDRLSMVEFSYRNAEHKTYRGSVIVADILGQAVANIMQALYAMDFPLEHPAAAGSEDPDHFGGTGGFNCRAITEGNVYSLHSYGTAIDINYGINPYIGGYSINNTQRQTLTKSIVPGNSDLRLFVRSPQPEARTGLAEAIRQLMKENGYIVWGGDWSNRIDYMHFQTTAFLSYLFPYLDKATGVGLLELSARYPEQFHLLDPDIYETDLKKWVILYQISPASFLKSMQKILPALKPGMRSDDAMLLVYQDLVSPQQ